ncbi:hypothetical protein DFH28DRAFT_1035894 [Melampsora americana]|nr:hypothetical protein DFH28DRAFT_1035894 [Melampsora americana]
MQIISLSLCAVGLLTSTINAARISTKQIRSEPLRANKTLIYSKQVSSESNSSHISQNWLASPAPSNATIREHIPAKPNATHIDNSYTEGQLIGYKAFISQPTKNASVPTHLFTEDKTFNRGLRRGYQAGMNQRATANLSDSATGVGSEQYKNGQLAGFLAALHQKVNNHARVSNQEFPTSILQHDIVFNAGARAGFEAGANSHISRVHSEHSSHQGINSEKSNLSSKIVSHSEKQSEEGAGSSVKQSHVVEVSGHSDHHEHAATGIKSGVHHHHGTAAKHENDSINLEHDVKVNGKHVVEHSEASHNQTQRLATHKDTKVGKKIHEHKAHVVSHSVAAINPKESQKTKEEQSAQFFEGRQVGMDASTRFPNSQPSAYFKKDVSFNSGVQAGFEANGHLHSHQ